MADPQAVLARSMKERDLQENVISTARALGWLVFHAYDSRRSTGSGYPDLTLARARNGGEVVFVELKTEKGKLTQQQALWGAVLAEQFFIWRPRDLLSGAIERALR